MSFSKIFIGSALLLFGVVGVMGWRKRATPPPELRLAPVVEEIALEAEALPEVDRIEQIFSFGLDQLPFVETISYTSRVPWLQGRPAWIADYASHYATSRHFIARSLNRGPDYITQKISPGDRFNVFRRDINLEFHLLVDLSRCKLWFYALDTDANERILIKTYRVSVGRLDPKKISGSLTPVGTYSLGEKVAIYKPGIMDLFQNQKTEMIRIFGTRWIPFDKEVVECSEPAKGLGIHGAPWVVDSATGQMIEGKMGQYDSDGCVRLAAADMEEIFSIVLTKPTRVEIVRDFYDAQLPGVEKR